MAEVIRRVVSTSSAPHALGSYSQAIQTGSLIYTSGQIALDPQTGEMVTGGVEEQTQQVIENLRAVLEAANSGLDLVVKTTCFLADMSYFGAFNEVYSRFFATEPPARSTFAVAGLPRGARVEIELVALTRS